MSRLTRSRHSPTPRFGANAFWRTLRFRFALWITLFLLVVLLLFSLFIYKSLQRNLYDAQDTSLRNTALQGATLIDWSNTEASIETARDQLRNRSVTIQFYDLSGQKIYATGSYANTVSPKEVFTAALNGQEVYKTVADPYDDSLRLFSAPVRRKGEVVGTVQTVGSLDDIEDSLDQLLILVEIGIPLFVLVIGVGGYWLAGRALAPIDRITATAASISTADLSARIDLPPTEDEVGRLAQTFNVMLDRLEGAFRRERQFTSDASHEMRTPLAALRTIAEMVLHRPRSSEDYQTALADILEEVVRLQRLVEDLLIMARQGTNPLVQKPEKLNLSQLLEDVANNLSALADARGLTMRQTIEPDLWIVGDRGALTRMFVNLIDNAIKYTPSGGLQVQAKPSNDNQLEVVIQDSGIGIAETHLPHVFERFYRGDPARTVGGTGLGLTIAEAIASAHQGHLRLESKAGVGTTCHITLPRASSVDQE